MKRLILLIVLGLLAVAFVFGSNFLKNNVNAPFLIPSSNNLVEQIINTKTGESPNISLSIPEGLQIGVFAKDLGNPRVLQFSPNGTLIASLMKQGEVVALPDKDKNGVAETKILLRNLKRPHGLAFYDKKLFVAEENRVVRYNFDENSLTVTFDKELFALPSGGRHYTRSMVFDRNGNLYLSLGSTCDVCVETKDFIATVIVSDVNGKTPRVFSRGLRNAVYLTLNPQSGKVWATEMGRDFLGDNIPPDEVNILEENGDFGWPYCYGNKVWDNNFGQKNQTFCNSTVSPFYQIPAHSAPLGLAFIDSFQLPDDWQGDLLVSYHGSWNRSIPTGYKIVRISTKGIPQEHDFITGFLDKDGKTLGRPAGLAFDKEGSLYIADDSSGAVYKLIKTPE